MPEPLTTFVPDATEQIAACARRHDIASMSRDCLEAYCRVLEANVEYLKLQLERQGRHLRRTLNGGRSA